MLCRHSCRSGQHLRQHLPHSPLRPSVFVSDVAESRTRSVNVSLLCRSHKHSGLIGGCPSFHWRDTRSHLGVGHKQLRRGLQTGPQRSSSGIRKDEGIVDQRANAYQRLDPVAHVLLRPGMYIGSTEQVKRPEWVYNERKMKMQLKTLRVSPALLTLFDEILVNAADNAVRDPVNTTRIDVTLSNPKEPVRISVRNNGRGIPVEIHPNEGIYVPELIFGHMMTGSNFTDEGDEMTGGRHGYGAKLTNIFSSLFRVSTCDTAANLLYEQSWQENMSIVNPPDIQSHAHSDDFTEVSFSPDLARLGLPLTGLTKDDHAALCRRVVDVAGTVGEHVIVTLNGKELPAQRFADYVQLYPGTENAVFGCSGPRWEYAVAVSDGDFHQTSFVNNVRTERGGTHVSALQRPVAKAVSDYVSQKHTPASATTTAIRRHLRLFVNAKITNPSFDSQVKDALTTKSDDFGTPCSVSSATLKEVIRRSGVVEAVVDASARADRLRLKRTNRAAVGNRKRDFINVPKLEDAVLAGTKQSNDCTLIITEGDSAKALAVAGFEVVGREKFGVFPIRGKLLNVRDASARQLTKNAEVEALCRIIGLRFDTKYPEDSGQTLPRTLRYGRVLIMADQDHDGAHVKGLVLNFFQHFWPELVTRGDFLGEFVTPILKAQRGSETNSFFSVDEYSSWWNAMAPTEKAKWRVKYYKGLGTSSAAEAREYFTSLEQTVKMFSHDGFNVQSVDAEKLDMAFRKDRAADRREWLAARAVTTLSSSTTQVIDNDPKGVKSVRRFVDNELVDFAVADNMRSIPSIVDGLKPSQRKVIYACFKRNLKKEIKVAQLAGYVAEHTAYHHGETSLHSTIIGMNQDFVGANNVPLLRGSGQFGTRHHGGKDAASARYIYTSLSPIARLIFPEEDDTLLQHCHDDGMLVEPEHYVPIIPLVLVNGAHGIGTGWSTSIPMHNPFEERNHWLRPHRLEFFSFDIYGLDFLPLWFKCFQVITNVERRIEEKPMKLMTPWYRGFSGTTYHDRDGPDDSLSRALPKRKASGFMLWLTANRERILSDYFTDDSNEILLTGREKVTEVAKVAGEIWRDMSEEEKAGAVKDAEVVIATRRVTENHQHDVTSSLKYVNRGVATTLDDRVVVEEIPIGKWTHEYKSYLLGLVDDGRIERFTEYHTDRTVRFELDTRSTEEAHRIQKILRLEKNISTDNMHAFDPQGSIRRYANSFEIIDDFYPIRRNLYHQRRNNLEETITASLSNATNRYRFLCELAAGDLRVGSAQFKSPEDLALELNRRGYTPFQSLQGESTVSTDLNLVDTMSYLLRIPILSVTAAEAEKAKSKVNRLSDELQAVRETSVETMWLNDLATLKSALSEEYGTMETRT